MKVLIVHNRYQSRHIGGEDLVVNREIKGLKQALGDENVFEYQVSNDDIHPRKLLVSLWGDKAHEQNIYQLVKQHKIDLVHVHNFFPLLTPSVFKGAKEAGAKVVHTLHNFRWWCLSGIFYRNDVGNCEACVNASFAWPAVVHGCYRDSKIQSAVGAMAYSWYQRQDYHHYIDAYFALSAFQAEKVQAWLPNEKIWIKPNPIEMTNKTISFSDKKDYLFIGRLEPSKGINWLLDIWVTLPKQFVLNIIGSEVESNPLSAYQSDNIRFLGKLSHEDTLIRLQQTKYFIHPSLTYETFGLTLVEALAASVPVIALDNGPRKEFIQTGKNGWLSSKENFKQSIMDSFEYVDYPQLAQQAFEDSQHYVLPFVMEKQLKIYQTIMSESSGL